MGGDYYAFHRHNNGWLAVIADCTGHGIPGAFMTVILQSALENALREADLQAPARILHALNHHIKQTLGQLNASQQTSLSNDGCDAIVLSVDTELHQLRWASARTRHLCSATSVTKSSRSARIASAWGYTDTPEDYDWPEQSLAFNRGDMLFVLTDGVTDQPGGERNIMFGNKRIQSLLMRYQHLPMAELSLAFQQDYLSWQGNQARRDDVTWFGFRY